jgi:predicted transcriptional regulator of viral defense system
MPGKNQTVLLETALDQHGLISTEDAQELGVEINRLPVMVKRNFLTRYSSGIYRVNLAPSDELTGFFEAYLWTKRQGVISHDSTLQLFGLGDVQPNKIHLTVPKGFRTAKKGPKYNIYKSNLLPAEKILYEGVPAVTPLIALKQVESTGLSKELIEQAAGEAFSQGLITEDDYKKFILPK